MKVVLDTNLWLSGWLWQGLPGNLIKLARKKEILTCTSVEILQEVEKVLSYQKLQKRGLLCPIQRRFCRLCRVFCVNGGLSSTYKPG